MTNGRTTAAAIVAAATLLTVSGAAVAQTGTGRTATQSDFDLCNREAQIAGGSITGGGAASPSTAPGVTNPSATGSVSGSPASGPTGAAGATGATGSLSGGSTLRGGGGATASGDVQLRGIGPGGANDAAYQQAYRDCMRRRGF